MEQYERDRTREDKDRRISRQREDIDRQVDRGREDFDNSQSQGNHNRRADDRRIEQIQETLEAFWKLFNGDGFNDPGIKGHIHSMTKTLNGTPEEPGLVAKNANHEKRIRAIENIKVFGIAFGVIIVGLVGWGRSIREFLNKLLGL